MANALAIFSNFIASNMPMKILIINVGSTSLKYKLYAMPGEKILSAGRLEGIGQPKSDFRYAEPGTDPVSGTATFPGYSAGIDHLLNHLLGIGSDVLASLDELAAVGFKTVLARGVVDGVILDDAVIGAMEEFAPLAPSHNPPYLAAIRDFRNRLASTPMIGLFEPAFHKTIPEYAWRYAVPFDWPEKYGIRRYGFHGASHRYAAERAAEMVGNYDMRVITCHLGGSSSINATRGTTSLDNSFGLSPQSGLIQSNRPGDGDMFIPLYLIEQLGIAPAEVRRMLSAESGLKGMSGVSGEMRDVMEAAASGNQRARLTADMFVYQVRKWIGSAAAILGGVDALVFTGGIGEHAAAVREKVAALSTWMGIDIDAAANAQHASRIDTAASRVAVAVVPTNEERMIARYTAQTLGL